MLKILIIDDEKFLIENLASYVKKKVDADIDLVTCANEALGLFENGSYDLVICDLNISDLSEGSLLLAINRIKPGQAFFVISAKALPDEIAANKNLRILSYFEKPFDASEIAKKIESIKYDKSYIVSQMES
ncbi:MAG: response regulator [Calditrichales bacterium]|nr:MAG: response regulator [Calditrichales bacterium]